MCFNYSYLFYDNKEKSFFVPPKIIDTNLKKSDFEVKDDEWDCVSDTNHYYQKLDIETKRIPSIQWFNINKKDVVAYFMAYFRMDKRKITKYKNLNPKVNYNIHEIDQNLPEALVSFFRHKYNKLYPKIEILCKFPDLLLKDRMNVKLNNWNFHKNCHHFSTWPEDLFKSSNNMRFSNLFIESFRLVYHIHYINNQIPISLILTKMNENRFKNMVIRQTIENNKFEWIKYPVARKTWKLFPFSWLLYEEQQIKIFKLKKTIRWMSLWKTNKNHKLQLAEEAKMKLLKLRTPYLLQPFDKEWQFNIWRIEFPSINPRMIYFDFLDVRYFKEEIDFYDLSSPKIFSIIDKFIFSTAIISSFTWDLMNISEKLSFALKCGFDWSSQLYIDRHTQAKHRMVTEMIKKEMMI
jgi:hypothetical protein